MSSNNIMASLIEATKLVNEWANKVFKWEQVRNEPNLIAYMTQEELDSIDLLSRFSNDDEDSVIHHDEYDIVIYESYDKTKPAIIVEVDIRYDILDAKIKEWINLQ